MNAPRCASCVFAAFLDNANRWIECRRNAPVPRLSVPNSMQVNSRVFPRVGEDDWCGEWKERPAAPAQEPA